MRPAFYASAAGGWRDYISLLHPPYTAWHLSYVVLGAALAPAVHAERLAATLLAFFLAVGIAAHAMDELCGRPLGTRIPRTVLRTLGVIGLAGAVVIGVLGAVLVSAWLLVFVAFGLFIAPAYNLEWFRGRFHTTLWFAAAWGAFPLLTSYWVNAEAFAPAAGLGALFAFITALAQRTLSERVRAVRRRVRSIEGRLVMTDGSVEDIDRTWALQPAERSLQMLSLAMAALAVAVLVARA
jgi:hypothetical protein